MATPIATVAKIKVVTPPPPVVAPKPKTVVAPAPHAKAPVLTPSNTLTTLQAAPTTKVKIVTPVVGKANYS